MSGTTTLDLPPAARDGVTRERADRLCYLAGPGGADWAARLDAAASLGFGHVVVPPLFTVGLVDGQPVATDLEAADEGLGAASATDVAAKLAAGAARVGLRVLMDVPLDRLAGPAAERAGSRFSARLLPATDPRRPPARSPACHARLGSAGDADGLAAFWGAWFQEWQGAGLAGFRLLGLGGLSDDHMPAFVSGLRRRCPDATLFAWTPGMAWPAVERLAGLVDAVASSLPWWDWRSDWLWRELRLLRRVAPVIACAEAPGGPRLARSGRTPEDLDALHRLATTLSGVLADGWMAAGLQDIEAEAGTLNRLRQGPHGAALAGLAAPLSGAGHPVLALLRTDAADARYARSALVCAFNLDPHTPRAIGAAGILPRIGAAFDDFEAVAPADGSHLDPAHDMLLAPADARMFWAAASAPARAAPVSRQAAAEAVRQPRFAIERPTPCVDGGRFPVKRIAGEAVRIEADVIADGHDVLGVAVRWRSPGDAAWHELPMQPIGNDRWTASVPLRGLGLHHYQVTAWRDVFATFRDELAKKHAAGVPTEVETREGLLLIQAAAAGAEGPLRSRLADMLRALQATEPAELVQALLASPTAELMALADARPHAVELDRPVPIRAERSGAAFAAWYELFPRSMSDDTARHGTFSDVERHLPRIRDMGFDVLYFPPIHPIGRTHRKGRNNALTAAEGEPGSPYAIGSAEGGHDALHPELGTFEEFERLRLRAAEHGLELAIDFAVQCSPDHPWLRDRRDWFTWRPDGTIRYAENPPKKYQDIVNVDFYAAGSMPDLWLALCNVVLFWAERGVRLFRVDNPHTKPFPFWEWMIGEVQSRYPDTVFLSEAFTRPKVMYRLAKVGFSQSYTYFTWRNSAQEFVDYLQELTQTAPADFFRPHFFVNTPDINPVFSQVSGRPGFLIRSALAATLSGLWGLYCGFELCESTPLPGREEYLDSEKYQLRAWDWDRPGNIVAEVTQLNEIRRLNPALHTHLGVTFLATDNPSVLCFEKAAADRSSVLVVAISFDPANPQSTGFGLPASASPQGPVEVDDLVGGGRLWWQPGRQSADLTPQRPYAIWRIPSVA